MKLLIKAVFLEHITTSGMNYIDHRPIDNWSVAGTFIDFVTLGNIDIVNTFATSRKKLPYGISWQTADLGQRSIFISSFYNFSGQSYNERRATYRAWPLSCQIDYEKLMKIQDSIPIPIYLNIPQWIEQPRFNPPDRSKAFNSINISLKGFTEFKSSIYGMWLYRIKERQTLFLFANTNFDIVMNEMYKSHAIKCDNEPREQFISSDEIENRVFKCEVCNDMYIITLCNNMLSAPKIVHSP
ncbi:hypothetical protein [Deinococcus soli (ex Cha et al. 2016)]|uniref:hypothetical protein n=1 Tax=Deinococcus soli (ex Cha et al. 2016) TaxID=1309411 RepID=UPI001E378CF2|nr:hypothetical protein [Deinococcus soli (ex Cha et al. 2016)]